MDIHKLTIDILEGSVIKSHNGVDLFTPDGTGFYPALWTRDLAYMLEYAGELIGQQRCEDCIEYLLAGADRNGWIPDRVYGDGYATYTAGDGTFRAKPNLDNGPYMIIAADAYLKTLPEEKAKDLFVKWEKALCAGIDCLPKNAEGVICNETTPPHSPYGFTDCIVKTGLLSFETLLLWQSIKQMLFWQEKFTAVRVDYAAMKASIEAVFADLFVSTEGMLYSATGIGKKLDVWGSCYLMTIDFPLAQKQKDQIANWLINHYDEIVYRGQIRHLPMGEYWEKTIVPVEQNTYQNGAFWATPIAWFAQALLSYDPALAKKTVEDLLVFFEEKGVFECVYAPDDYYKLDTYVASATNAYGAAKLVGLI